MEGKFCLKCSYREIGSNFCQECGTELIDLKKFDMKCKCGLKIIPWEKYCRNCGKMISRDSIYCYLEGRDAEVDSMCKV